MIKFFRKIRQRLLTENKFSKYLLYAIGEIVLVVIGILIALSINNWNEANKQKILEVKFLKRLKTDLVHDSIYFNMRITNARKYRANYAKGIQMAYETQQNLSELKKLLSLYSWSNENLTIQSDTYTELTSAGNLNILQSDTLKNAIIAYYRETDQAGKAILEFNTGTGGMAVNSIQLTNISKYQFSSGLFSDEMLFDADWSFMNDPSSKLFKYFEAIALTYHNKHGVFIPYFLRSKKQSNAIVKLLDAELDKLE